MLSRDDVIRMAREAGSIAVGEAADQIRALHAAGYWLARRTPLGVALPRAHYIAVCGGARPPDATPASTTTAPRPQVRTMAMRRVA